MKIIVNGELKVTQAGDLALLLEDIGIDGRVATAVNEEFVPEQKRSAQKLCEGDRVEILAPMQGG